MEIPADNTAASKRDLKKKLLRLLLEYGANPSMADENGESLRSLLRDNKELLDEILSNTSSVQLNSKPVCGPGRKRACDEFKAIVGLFKETGPEFSEETIYDLVYNDKRNGPENNDLDAPNLRWIHFPANNASFYVLPSRTDEASR